MNKNFVPLPYRRVSVQPYEGPWSDTAIKNHLLRRDAYLRTEFIILNGQDLCAVVKITKANEEQLFSPIETVEVLSLPNKCKWVEDTNVNPGNPSDLAEKALELGITPDETLVVRGRYEHTNFIFHPDPICIEVVDIIPPEPPKLYDLAKEALRYADLPAIHLNFTPIRIQQLVENCSEAEAYLVPCRASGLNLDKPVLYLDEHPSPRNWVLIGCEKSCKIHKQFYGYEPKRIEMCPRKLIPACSKPTLVKCCQLENSIEIDGKCAVVPWGAELHHVVDALRALVQNSSIL